MNIDELLRAQYVKRFHIVHTVKHQSVAEHCFNVAMIAREIAMEMGLDSSKMIMMALFHDIDEVITGDIPTPTKERAKQQGVDLNDNGIEVPYQKFGPVVIKIVKIADYIEAMSFLRVNGVGLHASSVGVGIQKHMEGYLTEHFNYEEILNVRAVIRRVTYGGSNGQPVFAE
jgi:putative nucleotidyltransferase with HDIG domain